MTLHSPSPLKPLLFGKLPFPMHVRLPARCKSKLRHACVCPCVKKSEPNQSRVTSIEETCPRKSPQHYPLHRKKLPESHFPWETPQALAGEQGKAANRFQDLQWCGNESRSAQDINGETFGHRWCKPRTAPCQATADELVVLLEKGPPASHS